MCKIISIANQKGGVGKTTTTASLACVLKKKGYKVLAVDFDPQGNLSFFMNAEKELSATIYNVLKGEVKTQYAIQRTRITDILPSNILLSGIELEFTDTGREFLLRDALKPVKEMYDYILIDPPPGLGILTVNAFTASVNPMEPLVVDRLDAAFTKFNCCRCDKCKKDVAAIALNKLVPKQVVTAAMDIPKLTAKYTGMEVATAIVQAIIQVRSKPRH